MLPSLPPSADRSALRDDRPHPSRRPDLCHHLVLRQQRLPPLRAPPSTAPIALAPLIGHNDIAPYNVCFDGDDVAGVFDWDLAGPTAPLMELAFIAWNCVPLWRDIGEEASADRIRRICAAYGGVHPAQIV